MLRVFFIVSCLFTHVVLAAELPGNWKLISGEFIDESGATVAYKSLKLNAIKVLTDTHFSFVTESGGKFWAAGAGKYTSVNDWYIENPNLSSFNAPANKLYKFRYKIEKDTWILERWESGNRVEFEVWQRF